MLLFDNVRLTDLRTQLAKVRLEKIALMQEIKSTSNPLQRLMAKRRHASASTEMHHIAKELEAFIASTKISLTIRKIF